MHSLSAVDLNLVVALHALLEERSVTRAAVRLGLSQPAVSHALSRLRTQFDDPLLMRSGRRMVLTARAEALRPQVQLTVLQLEGLMCSPRFNPAGLETRVRVVTDDGIGFTLLPHVLRAMVAEAPGVGLNILPRGVHPDERRWSEPARRTWQSGASAVPGWTSIVSRCTTTPGCVYSAATTRPSGTGLDASTWATSRHVIVSPTGGQRGEVDAVMQRAGLTRHVVLAVPHFLAALAIVAGSDLVLTTPQSVARSQAVALELRDAGPTAGDGAGAECSNLGGARSTTTTRPSSGCVRWSRRALARSSPADVRPWRKVATAPTARHKSPNTRHRCPRWTICPTGDLDDRRYQVGQ